MLNKKNIRFNYLKHHLGYINAFVTAPPANWTEQLLMLGTLHFDIYTGKLAFNEIERQLLRFLYTVGITTRQQYFDFIGDELSYKVIAISDDSNWILRWGNEAGLFIHVHPARFGLHICRVKAAALKTAIALLVNNINYNDLSEINKTRLLLKLSPINKKGFDSIVKLLALIQQGE